MGKCSFEVNYGSIFQKRNGYLETIRALHYDEIEKGKNNNRSSTIHDCHENCLDYKNP